MLKNSIILFYFFISIALAVSIQSSALADDGKGLESHLSIGIGWEQLEYKEHEPDKSSESNAKVSNVVIGIEGLKRWESVIGGIKATIPVLIGENEEAWTSSGRTFQTNTLEYGWMRTDGFIGYSLNYLFIPYVGLRWSESKQDRSNFIEHGTIFFGATKEQVRSWSALLGVRGNGNLTSRWKWNYSIEYFVPIDVKVTNSAIPGFEASDKDGYTLDLKWGAEYSYKKTLSFGLLIYGGRMHWNGSDWKPSPGGLAKWPENNTDYLCGTLNIRWKF